MLCKGNIKVHQRKLWNDAKNFNSFLVIILSDYNKAFAIFFPTRFEKTAGLVTDTQLCFYWINDDQLVTCSNPDDSWFESTNDWLLRTRMGIGIHNDRKEWDNVALKSSVWYGMEQGKDNYPSNDGSRYFIAGGQIIY